MFQSAYIFSWEGNRRKGHCAHGISSVQHEFILLLSAALPDPSVVLEGFSFVANLGDEMNSYRACRVPGSSLLLHLISWRGLWWWTSNVQAVSHCFCQLMVSSWDGSTGLKLPLCLWFWIFNSYLLLLWKTIVWFNLSSTYWILMAENKCTEAGSLGPSVFPLCLTPVYNVRLC